MKERLVLIDEKERKLIHEKFPKIAIIRTVIHKSKRHHYYCEEDPEAMLYLEEIRRADVIEQRFSKLREGDCVKYKFGSYRFDSFGNLPSGVLHKGEDVYITKIVSNPIKGQKYPFHISLTPTLGDGDLGWVKLKQLSIIGD